MHISPILLIHICGATVGLLSGFLAMAFRKGSGLHAAAGNAFFVSMLAMSACGAYLAAFVRPVLGNLIVALLTFYLVATARRAARNRSGAVGWFDVAALVFVFAIAATALTFGFKGTSQGGIPPFGLIIFGSCALRCVISDIRMLRRGGAAGAQRIARHLWRMCMALLITVLSFYPGQAKLFPASLRGNPALFVPHILLVGSFIFWAVRVRRRTTRLSTITHSPSLAEARS